MKDYGCDPLGDGTFRMVPSGDIVDFAEKNRRLPRRLHVKNDCIGLSWEQLAMKQGGLHTLDITRKGSQK
jgi:hypothetical protein